MSQQIQCLCFHMRINTLKGLNLKCNKTGGCNVKMIEVKVVGALRQLKYIANQCEKWLCLPSVSCQKLGTKGAVARQSS